MPPSRPDLLYLHQMYEQNLQLDLRPGYPFWQLKAYEQDLVTQVIRLKPGMILNPIHNQWKVTRMQTEIKKKKMLLVLT